MKTLTAPQLQKVLSYENIVKKRDGSGYFIIRQGYFQKHMMRLDQFIEGVINRVENLNLNIEVIDSGWKWTTTHCGPLKENTHMWVVVNISEK